jgi:hypothetical protein
LDTPEVPTETILEHRGAIAVDKTCRRCGYNLRGLSADGRCPECGTAVAISLEGDLLRYAAPRWVERLGRGSRFILNGLSAALLFAIATGILNTATFGGPTGTKSLAIEALTAICEVALLIGLVAAYCGTWMMTAPDPTRAGEDRYATSRKLVRIALLIGLANVAVQEGLAAISAPSAVDTLMSLIDTLANVAALVGWLAYLRYLAKLALRIPDEGLSKRARFLFGAFLLVPLSGVFLAVMAGLLVALGTGGGASGLGVCLAVTLVISMLVLLLLALRLQHRIGQACREQARLARQVCADDSPTD